jgi:hypothetical protein
MAKEVNDAKLNFDALRKWNQWLAGIFFVQAVAIAVASVARPYPITLNFLGTDTLQSQAAGHAVLATGTRHLFDLNLVIIVVLFLLVAAITHALAATKLRTIYEHGLRIGLNKIRWIEYVFGAGLVLVAIGILVGVQDLATLLTIFGLTAIASLLDLIVERQVSRGRTSWIVFGISCASCLLAWVVVGLSLTGTAIYGTPSIFAWIIAAITFLMFAASGVNLYLQQRKFGNWANYLFSEKLFMVLSLVTKTLLAWLLFADVLHP